MMMSGTGSSVGIATELRAGRSGIESYEHSDRRNDGDSNCYVCAGMYARYLNKSMLVKKKIPVGTTFSVPVQTGPGAHPASCTIGTGSFLGVKCGRDVLLTTHPLLVPRSWESRAIPLPTLWATPGL